MSVIAWIGSIKKDMKARNMDIRAAAEVTVTERSADGSYNLIASKPDGRETRRRSYSKVIGTHNDHADRAMTHTFSVTDWT